jgi:hypothetical protein
MHGSMSAAGGNQASRLDRAAPGASRRPYRDPVARSDLLLASVSATGAVVGQVVVTTVDLE